MLCQLSVWGNFATTWAVLSLLGFMSIVALSTPLFLKYYVNYSFETWQYKSCPRYPSAEKVRAEVITMIKGMLTATFCPALTLYLMNRNASGAYCGSPYGWKYEVGMFFVTWFISDFYEFFYHYLGHRIEFMWNQHKYHHKFYNPSPFAVIADEYLDQLLRAAPLLFFPLLFTVNIEMLFVQYGMFFYGYGVYLHWGFEFANPSWPQYDHPIINTSFQHYCHHAVSVNKKPYHCGFFFKIWDQLFGAIYTGKACLSAKQQREMGKRSKAEWEKVSKPDYSPLLRPAFWAEFFTCDDPFAMTDTSVKDK